MDPVNDRPRVLGNRYEVGELLGRGGMAEVHLGRDTRLGRVVAIKLLRTDLARDATFQARFRREAQSAAVAEPPGDRRRSTTPARSRWSSPAAALVTLPYIVMEYVEGRTLRELLHDGPPARRRHRARRHRAACSSALEYSHRAGIVHRDIKPANVMLTPNGDVKVMDFGIARAIADASSTMTQTQAVIGTAQYLSPEQARGETVDARSDLYSAGLPALRAAHRPAAVRRRLPGRRRLPARARGAAAAERVQPGGPRDRRPDRPALAGQGPREPLPDRRDEFRADIEAALAGRPVSAHAAGAGAAAGAATTQFLGAAGAGTRTMQPVDDP